MSEPDPDKVAKGILLASVIVGFGAACLCLGLGGNWYLTIGVGILTGFCVSIFLVIL